MISRQPETKDIALNVFLQEIRGQVNNYIMTLDVPVSTLGTGAPLLHGKHVTTQLQAGETSYFEFIVPHSLNQIKEVVIRFIPTVTGTIGYTVNLSYGGVGEDENANTKTLTVSGVAVVDDQITAINTSYPTNLWTDIDTGDQVGVELILNSATTTTDIQVLSLCMKYI